jgi:hypothetical protein
MRRRNQLIAIQRYKTGCLEVGPAPPPVSLHICCIAWIMADCDCFLKAALRPQKVPKRPEFGDKAAKKKSAFNAKRLGCARSGVKSKTRCM